MTATMTPQEVLAAARSGDQTRLKARTSDVADAVRALVEAGEVESALEIVGRAWRIWSSSGKLEEGAAAARVALDSSTGPTGVWRARALYGDGVVAFRQNDAARSRARNVELLQQARAIGDARGVSDGLTGLARLALRDGDYETVISLARQGRDSARTAGDLEAEAGPLHLEAAGLRLKRRYAEARELYQESLELNQRLRNAAYIAMEQHNLGWIELHLGDVDAAEAWFDARDASAQPDAYSDAWQELNRAGVAAARTDWAQAREHFARGSTALQALGVELDPDDAFEREWLERQLAERAC